VEIVIKGNDRVMSIGRDDTVVDAAVGNIADATEELVAIVLE